MVDLKKYLYLLPTFILILLTAIATYVYLTLGNTNKSQNKATIATDKTDFLEVEVIKNSDMEYQLIVYSKADPQAFDLSFTGSGINAFTPNPIYDGVIKNEINSSGNIQIAMGKWSKLDEQNLEEYKKGYVLGAFDANTENIELTLNTSKSIIIVNDKEYKLSSYSINSD